MLKRIILLIIIFCSFSFLSGCKTLYLFGGFLTIEPGNIFLPSKPNDSQWGPGALPYTGIGGAPVR